MSNQFEDPVMLSGLKCSNMEVQKVFYVSHVYTRDGAPSMASFDRRTTRVGWNIKMFCGRESCIGTDRGARDVFGRPLHYMLKMGIGKQNEPLSRRHVVPAGLQFTLSCFCGACRFVFNVFWNRGRRRRVGMMQFTGLSVLSFPTAIRPCMSSVQ